MNVLPLFHIVPIFLFLIISVLWTFSLFHNLFVYILILFQAYKPILEMLQGKEKVKHLQAFNLESWWRYFHLDLELYLCARFSFRRISNLAFHPFEWLPFTWVILDFNNNSLYLSLWLTDVHVRCNVRANVMYAPRKVKYHRLSKYLYFNMADW